MMAKNWGVGFWNVIITEGLRYSSAMSDGFPENFKEREREKKPQYIIKRIITIAAIIVILIHCRAAVYKRHHAVQALM